MPAIARDRAKISDLREALDLYLSKLPPDAPVRQVIAAPEVEKLIASFDQADATAIKEQKSYRRHGRLALWATMAATIIGAIVLLPIDERLAGWPKRIIEALQGVALTVSFIATIWTSWRQSVSQWLQARASAEGVRGDVFRAIIGEGGARGLLGPALACFVKAHLDWQLAYYTRAGKRYRRSAGNAAPYKMLGYLILAVAVLAGLVSMLNLAATFDWAWPVVKSAAQRVPLADSGRWQLGLGAMSTAILAYASARSFMDQDDRHAVLCEMAKAQLEEIKHDRLREAEAAAATATPTPLEIETVMGFTREAQSIMSAEHLAWIYPRPLHEVSVVPKRAL